MKKTLLIIVGLFIAIQFIKPTQQNAKVIDDLQLKARPEVMKILKTSCYDCHSDNTIWPWYSKIAPFSWTITAHVVDGREAVNFSIWETYSKEKKQKELKSIYKKVYASMPLKSYVWIHKDAILTKDQIKTIRDWTGVRR
ncbi:cytochrome C [Malaciobacter molluscorum LMG 25693]|uniref:Cytochrome C n=1 Tax=Malaciobacter molluscorum LMG 25693 TaxID=870501 RepID=A0A2G1DFA0_9BACT|nr:heme-binding domain-containing protein [Malaciobacter molluscorum]AXX91528.1 heme-binding domain-containing protein [Malaciobacter molluscorum LMG 25693]PHO17165.1 cytochrome C [Malaciobacter molluscorum LMG 25693]RXJ92775.1 cytochrome C [Malaciobacter molluscorum]